MTKAMILIGSPQRGFNIDIETCEHCGGAVKIIASTEDPAAINAILGQVEKTATRTPHPLCAPCHPPPELRQRG